MSSSNRSRRQFTTQPSLFYLWMRQALSNLGAALGPPASSEPSKREKELVAKTKELEAKWVKKDNVIAEISAEYVALKESLGSPNRSVGSP